jgi:molybdopterin molybdotransferase
MRPAVQPYPMLGVEEALDRVLAAFEPLPPERVPVLEALGQVLTGDVFADMDIPPRGTEIRPQEVGMLAALGHKETRVHRRPRVAILSTGDEVIEIDTPWRPGKIRNANSYSNAAQVVRCGGVPLLLGIARDNVDELTDRIRTGLGQEADLFLTSGGVSMGDFDMVKAEKASSGGHAAG